jgi:aminopeptidase C
MKKSRPRKQFTKKTKDAVNVLLCSRNDSSACLPATMELEEPQFHPVSQQGKQQGKPQPLRGAAVPEGGGGGGGVLGKGDQDCRKPCAADSDSKRRQQKVFQKALSNAHLDALTLDRGRLEFLGQTFSHEIRMPQTVLNQRASGRCWIFAYLNILRKHLIQIFGLPSNFELSASYLAYYDLLEKSNLFLSLLWTLKDREDHRENTMLHHLLKSPIGDGGQWNLLQNLVAKYGVVPQSAMPETMHSGNTARVNAILRDILRSCATLVLHHSKSGGASVSELEGGDCSGGVQGKVKAVAAKKRNGQDEEGNGQRERNGQGEGKSRMSLKQFLLLKSLAMARIRSVLNLFYGEPPVGTVVWEFVTSHNHLPGAEPPLHSLSGVPPEIPFKVLVMASSSSSSSEQLEEPDAAATVVATTVVEQKKAREEEVLLEGKNKSKRREKEHKEETKKKGKQGTEKSSRRKSKSSYGDKKKSEKNKSENLCFFQPGKRIFRLRSPKDFYEQVVLGCGGPFLNLDHFVCLMHYPVPRRPLNRWYTVQCLNNMVNGREPCFFNASMDVLEEAVLRSLDAGEPVWFAADVSSDASWSQGVLDPECVSSDDLFRTSSYSHLLKSDRAVQMAMCSGSPNHAMVIKGYDLQGGGEKGEEGKERRDKKKAAAAAKWGGRLPFVVKYLVENSWGSAHLLSAQPYNSAPKGTDVIMSREWFRKHVYNVAVHVRHLEFVADRLREKRPILQMDAWEPFGGLL